MMRDSLLRIGLAITLLAGCVTPTNAPPGDAGSQMARDAVWLRTPEANQTVTPPFDVEGAAPGTWYFEGVLPLEIRDDEGNVLHQESLRAEGDWMTSELVPFATTVDLQLDDATPAVIVLRRDNPSGLPARDEQATVPIMLVPGEGNGHGLSDQERQRVEEHVRAHIAELAPAEPVLGGSFHVTEISWLADGAAQVDYEDGHEHHVLELRADVSGGRVEIEEVTAVDVDAPIERKLDGKIVYTTRRLFGDELEAVLRDCERRGGTLDKCGSPCADGEMCVEVCAYTCELPAAGP